MIKRVYFDNAATTALHPKVIEEMERFSRNNYGNPSSIHYFGRKTRVEIEKARETLAEFINAEPAEIFFTSGGTEAINLIIRGIINTLISEGVKTSIATSGAEHHAVLETVNELSEAGVEIKFVDVNLDAGTEINSLQKTLTKNTSLISLMHVNNETGTINNILELSASRDKSKTLFFTDTIQSFGKFPIDVNKLNVNAVCGSAHKINGPKGIGFAFVKRGTPISPLILGGSQERSMRGGTENTAGIIGLAAAVKIASGEMEHNFERVNYLKNVFIDGITSLDPEGIIINSGENSSPFILSITLSEDYYNVDAESYLMFLDLNGVAVSSGSACTSGTLKPSHVILSTGRSEKAASGTLRFSFSAANTNEEVDYTLEVLGKLKKKFRRE